MPPRITRTRGVGGGAVGTHPHSNKASQAYGSVAEGEPVPGGIHQPPANVDTYHNSDQPCCSNLTKIAQLIFPSQLNGKPNGKTNDQNVATSEIEVETHHDWYTLLRGYLLFERIHRKEEDSGAVVSTSASNKKKKKKKRKKKGVATVQPETLQDSAEFFDAAENEEDGDENELIVTTPSTLYEDESPMQDNPVMHTGSNSSLEWDHRLQQERIRRIQQLLNRFIDQTCRDTELYRSAMNNSMSLNIMQLHEFISMLSDDSVALSNDEKGTSIVSPTSKRNQKDSCSPTVISRKRIELELEKISCVACRNDVERILLPNLASPSSTIMKHPPFRQLLLKNLIIPTMYDTIDHEQELEQRASQYHSLMEEGVAPPEHTRHWSFHIQTKELLTEPNTTTASTASSSSVAAATAASMVKPSSRPRCDVIGWELRRPIVLQQHILDVLPGPPLSEVTTSNHVSTVAATTSHNNTNEKWTMSQIKFLIDHYVLLLGLPADEILMPTDTTTTTPPKTLTANDYAAMSSNVSGKVRTLADKFHELASMIERSYQQFMQSKQYQVENTGCTTDWQTFAILKNEIDETCRVVMNELLNINIDITRAVHRVLSHVNAGIVDDSTTTTNTLSAAYMSSRHDAIAESKWATAHCHSIWQAYLSGCTSIISEREKYEAQVFDLAEERVSGKCIPDMMVSPAARSLYSMFINSKLGIVVRTMQIIERQLNASTYIGGWHTCCSTNTNATFVARLFTEDLFFTVIHGLKESDHTCPEIDQSFENILKAIREMTDTVYEQRVDVVLEKYQHQRDKLHRIINKTIALLDDVTTPTMILLRLELIKIQNIPWEDDAKNEFCQWKSTVNKAIEMWVHYRLDYTVPGFIQQPTPIIPYELRRSMRPDTTVLFSEQTQQCRGGNEQHRAICILVGLFFENLSETFKEWQAQRAEQELLTSMVEDEESEMTLPTTHKTNKKQKRKVKKHIMVDHGKDTGMSTTKVTQRLFDEITDSEDELRQEAAVQSNETVIEKEINDTLGDNKLLLLDRELVGKDLNHIERETNETSTTTASETTGKTKDINSSRADISSNGTATTPSEQNPPRDVSLESSEITLPDDIAEASVSLRDDVAQTVKDGTRPNIGVYDVTYSEGFQSAEDFLIGRFHQIIKSNETIVVIL